MASTAMARMRGRGASTFCTFPATSLSSVSGYEAPERFMSVTHAVMPAFASEPSSTRL